MLEPRFVLVQPARNFLSTLRKRDFIDVNIDIVHSTSMTGKMAGSSDVYLSVPLFGTTNSADTSPTEHGPTYEQRLYTPLTLTETLPTSAFVCARRAC